MTGVVNLNKARKAQARAAAKVQAAENRVVFGRGKNQKAAEAAEAKKAGRRLDGAQREKS